MKHVYISVLCSFYFMHDALHELLIINEGAHVHSAKLSGLWRQAYNTQKFQWLVKSPDLNPIVNVWKTINNKVRN